MCRRVVHDWPGLYFPRPVACQAWQFFSMQEPSLLPDCLVANKSQGRADLEIKGESELSRISWLLASIPVHHGL